MILSNITGTLSTLVPHVIIAPATARFGNLAVNGTSVNEMPFQISTLPAFPCGTPLSFQLAINTAPGSLTTTFSLPTACTTGVAFCATCPGNLTGAITTNDPGNNVRLSRTFVAGGTCALPTDCPGQNAEATNAVRYDVLQFTNADAAACYSVYLSSTGSALFASAYVGGYNPANLCQNYLADSGNSGPFLGFSFVVPAQTNFVVVVNNIPSVGAGGSYRLVVSGAECPPSLAATKVPGNRVRLAWPTSAAGYLLDAAPEAAPAVWAVASNQTFVVGTNFVVTNALDASRRFFRLRRPE